ncbi:VOC family protein [Collinsella sp. Sow4_D11]|uniref:VOC family protein n=1 Tax=Collinsella sp. Sow4_D11 TaxID=3438775 RepID=UPI003F904ECD
MALYVHDLYGARTFFETYLGATAGAEYHNPTTGFRSFFLTFEDGARLEIMTKPGIAEADPAQEALGLTHLAFSAGSAQAVDELTQRLVDAGYACVSGPRTTGDGYYESCVTAFEGVRIEITV